MNTRQFISGTVSLVILLLGFACSNPKRYTTIPSETIVQYKGKSGFEIICYAKPQESKQNTHLVSTELAISLMGKDTVILINKDYKAEVKIHELVFFANKPLKTDSIIIPVTEKIKAKMNSCKIYYGVITSADE